MEYFRPESVEDAIALLDAEDARCLAGGQTLVAMMNTRIIAPPRLVSLRAIPDLGAIETRDDGGLRIGAMVTHRQLEDAAFEGAHRMLSETAAQIASPAIRAFGTVGGSLCHADPAADWPVALIALGAEAMIAGPAGGRTEPVEDFIVDALTTSLAAGEILTHIGLPPTGANAGGAYLKLARVEGDFATVSVAVSLSIDGGVCSDIRVVIGGCGPVPVRDAEAEAELRGAAVSDGAVAALGDRLAEVAKPEDDGRASAAYRRMVIPGLVRRAVEKAAAAA